MITIKELAKELSVSISTVSKALNDNPEISEDTVKRVKELARLRNYKPNKTAVNLKNSSTKTIGVIIPDILNPFFAKVLLGIESQANSKGYNIITCVSQETEAKEKENLQLLADGTVDGFILAVAEETQINKTTQHFTDIINDGFPIVMFDRVSDAIDCDKVIIDDFDASYQATKLLIDEGRTHIVLLNYINELSVGQLRIQGYLKALEDSAKVLEPHLITIDKSESLDDSIKAMFSNDPKIDGIVAIDNTSGIASLNIAKSLDIKVPVKLSIIGFSSDELLPFSYPKLSTVSQNATEIGKVSVDLLVARLRDTSLEKRIETVAFDISERDTTK
ncbi:LacI family DNA-binding transcriptional regulator [Winogradskyella maritima]|uniref:LacI family DNA-binding transcriptional regulator n=1 Tax=Winogradskyella maritima TaxID=1517766 RepID=A0ABV8AHK5_9FLAO|nr:LacI family DNA-binding transcriptional regulator [Winogradskyella maritima]